MPEKLRDAAAGPACCLLINPRSFRAARKQLWQRAAELARRHGAAVRIETTPEGFSSAVTEFQQQARLIIVMGGDGTLQGLLSQCYRADRLAHLPPLMMLGGGRTNLIAANFNGTGGDILARLEKTLGQSETGAQTHTVPTFVLSGDSLEDQVGLFLAGAVLDQTIRDLHEYRAGHQGRWRDGPLASTAWLTRRALTALTRIRPFTHPRMQVQTDALGILEGAMRYFMLSTLDQMGSGITPWADRGEGVLRCLCVRADAQRFWLRLPGLLKGRFNAAMTPEHGYLSGRCNELSLQGLHYFCVDGQEFKSASGRVRICAGPAIRFVEPVA